MNETFARKLLPGLNPIGRRFRVEASPRTPEQQYEIVGLVGDAKYRRLSEAARPVIFVAILQRGGNVAGGTYVVRTATALQGVAPAVRDARARGNPRLRLVVRGREARKKPQNIAAMPAVSAIENPGRTPVAANADPAATIVAPTAIPSVPRNRSRSSGAPRILHADQSVPATSTAYVG